MLTLFVPLFQYRKMPLVQIKPLWCYPRSLNNWSCSVKWMMTFVFLLSFNLKKSQGPRLEEKKYQMGENLAQYERATIAMLAISSVFLCDKVSVSIHWITRGHVSVLSPDLALPVCIIYRAGGGDLSHWQVMPTGCRQRKQQRFIIHAGLWWRPTLSCCPLQVHWSSSMYWFIAVEMYNEPKIRFVIYRCSLVEIGKYIVLLRFYMYLYVL